MDEEKNADAILQEVCERTGVHPAAMLILLFVHLANRHKFSAGFFTQDTRHKHDVFQEIRERLRHTGVKRDAPISLVALLDMILQDEQSEMEQAEKTLANESDEDQKALFEGYRRTSDAFRLFLKELMNQSEHAGIQTRLDIEREAPPDERHGADDDPESA